MAHQDHQSYYYHQTELKRQNRRIDRWLSSLGVTAQDLEQHRQLPDVIAMLNIRHALWALMTSREQTAWRQVWHMVFDQQRPIHTRTWQRLEQITQSIQQRQQLIHQLRQHEPTGTENKGRNMTANCPDQSDSKLVKRKQLGGRKEPQLI